MMQLTPNIFKPPTTVPFIGPETLELPTWRSISVHPSIYYFSSAQSFPLRLNVTEIIVAHSRGAVQESHLKYFSGVSPKNSETTMESRRNPRLFGSGQTDVGPRIRKTTL